MLWYLGLNCDFTLRHHGENNKGSSVCTEPGTVRIQGVLSSPSRSLNTKHCLPSIVFTLALSFPVPKGANISCEWSPVVPTQRILTKDFRSKKNMRFLILLFCARERLRQYSPLPYVLKDCMYSLSNDTSLAYNWNWAAFAANRRDWKILKSVC